MKRIASLFLLVTLFYNVLGYYLMFAQQEEQAWVAAMENKESLNFKVLRINASVYTFLEDTDFESVNENMIINFNSYHVFKKRIQNNILSLYYLPNIHQNKIGKSLNDVVDNQLFDTTPSKEKSSSKLLKTFFQDYVAHEAHEFCFSSKKEYKYNAHSTAIKEALHSGYTSMLYSPPDFV